MVCYYRRLIIGVLLGLICLALPATQVLASDPIVQITVSAWVWGNPPPSNFTVYYISDYEVGFTWTLPPGEVNTMIRAKYGSYPTGITDGYLVYYDNGESCSDTAVSLDETATPVYYRAWCEDAFGGWSALYAEGFIEGGGMKLIALIVLALGLMIVGYAWKRQALVFGAVGGWMVLGVYSYTLSTAVWDIYFTLFFFCMGLVIVSALEAMYLREKPPEPPRDMDSLDEYNKSWDDYDNDMERYRRTIGGRRGRSRKREDENNTRLV